MKKGLIIITSLVMICTVLIACSKNSSSDITTTTTTTTSTNSTSESTSENSTTTTVATTVKDEKSKSLIESMYSDYDVKLDKTVDNVQYYTISKNDKEYSRLKVDLVTGDCYETNSTTNELTTFNLLS